MLLRKLWRTMGLYKAQFISMIIMIALGVGVFVGFNMEWYSIDKNTSEFFSETGFADYRIVSDFGFSEDELKKVEGIDGVSEATRYVSLNADVKDSSGDSLALTVTENADVSAFTLISGNSYDEKSEDGIWLSDQYAAKNNINVNDELTLTYKNIEITGTVKGLIKSGEHMICVRDETQLMPDYSTFGYCYISPAMYEKAIGMAFYPQINVISGLSKKDFTKAIDEKVGKTLLVLTKDENISYSGAHGEIDEGKTMGSVLPVIFLLIAVLTMVTTMHRLTAKEKTQIGTLKALGFKDSRILRHYTSYGLMIGVIGTIVGTALGYLIAWFIMNPTSAMGAYIDIPTWTLYLPWFCYIVLIVMIAMLTFISFLSVKQMLKGTAADALRAYSPKKMKAMLIEKTKLFHRLSFGTRWNLRDTMRHKSRTAMSLFGIIGCMMIIVCAMGMNDTMNAYLDSYYNGATNYSSRIFLSEEATDDERNSLIEEYNGDWSASTSVQIEEQAVSLDIYNISNNMVRFMNTGNGYTDIGSDGAYLCMRLIEKYNLSVGDVFTISPYGSDDKYTLKVAGAIRSATESIVISSQYAQEINIPYTIDSIYTETDKSDITSTQSIKSIQSKQMIIDSFDSFTEMMNLMIVILILAAAVLGVVVLYNLGVMSYAERYREMATLKVVGFKDKKIGSLLIEQNLWTTILGILLGLPIGIGVLYYMLKKLAPEYEMRMVAGPATYLVSILLTFGVSLLVSIMVSRKNRKIDMVEALKGAE